MDSVQECKATTSADIPNTLQQGSEPKSSEQPISKKPTDSEQRTDPGAKKLSAFTLLDLARLTFSLDGVQVLNVQDATNEQFGQLADLVANVSNVEAWYLEERRDFVNQLYAWCTERSYDFPFTIADEERIPTAVLASGECL